MIKYDIEGVDSLLKTLRQKRRVYSYYKQRIVRNASKIGLKITQDSWVGIGDENDIKIALDVQSNGFIITVSGTQVLFLEFGAGSTYASTVHPMAKELGYGPGTYPGLGTGNWNNPQGWIYYSNDPTKVSEVNQFTGQGLAHTYGEPAWGATYKSAEIMKQEFTAMVIKELTRA